MAMARPSLDSDTVRGILLSAGGLALLAIGAQIPIPSGGGVEAVAAGFAILLGFAALLLGVILFLMAPRV